MSISSVAARVRPWKLISLGRNRAVSTTLATFAVILLPAEQMADMACGVGAKGVEYPQRFFARDFAGNRLEFSL